MKLTEAHVSRWEYRHHGVFEPAVRVQSAVGQWPSRRRPVAATAAAREALVPSLVPLDAAAGGPPCLEVFPIRFKFNSTKCVALSA